MSNRTRIEGTLAALREEWSDTQARLKAIEDAIRAVSLLLDSSPSLVIGGSDVLLGGLTISPPSSAAGIAIASGAVRARPQSPIGSAAAGKAVASTEERKAAAPVLPPSRRPPLRDSILGLLKERPGLWGIDALASEMRERRLVGGGSDKTARETVRQAANKMAVEGEIRREGSRYAWPPDPLERPIRRFRSDVMGRLTKHLDAAADPSVNEHAGS